ncbi:histone deacetylase [Spirochaeta thermophila]|uniref:Histone deacetylase superfamily n=1 Tax=Winmispira thermophila (strain ATCC 49972 / DSM 6192 / RI 19.B1) TaxID=665571 RepID=E0RPF5_WINT6|nr:histone deacetylase [Spirochaeta thermophila]ADN02737.1 histone deacetylase superfamily [Spirochaeta thermophila DSM 6192]
MPRTEALIFRPALEVSFEEFGILIPIADDRTSRVLASLREAGVDTSRLVQVVEEPLITREDLLRVHEPSYVEDLFSSGLERRLLEAYELVDERGGYVRYAPERASRPLSELLTRVLLGATCTYLACLRALRAGHAFSCAGGYHHAHAGFGHGFCVINDVVIALRRLMAEGRIRRAWVVDVDVHKGDGTAALTKDDPSIATLSIHMAAGWPLSLPSTLPDGRPHPSHIPSTVEIPVARGEEARYHELLGEGLTRLEEHLPHPDLAVVVWGADPYEKDELPSAAELSLSLEALFERDLLLWEFMRAREVPAAFLMAGGYGPHAWEPFARFLRWVFQGEGNVNC